MTYLQLINNVLTRLREDEILNLSQLQGDPYFKFIGSAVNDAKDRVEDAWDWSALRGADYQAYTGQMGTLTRQGTVVTLPNSADSHYRINRVYSSAPYTENDPVPKLRQLRQLTVDGMRQRYQGGTASAPRGQPYEFAVTGRAPSTNDIVLTLFPAAKEGETYTVTIDRTNHQPALDGTTSADNADGIDRNTLLVPSLPVYTLATALASRERGEVGGTPTSELFAIADRHLSDAVAQDSALYSNELVWYVNTDESNTNVRFA